MTARETLIRPLNFMIGVLGGRAKERDVLKNTIDNKRRFRVLLVLAIAELLGMTLRFSASAVSPELADV